MENKDEIILEKQKKAVALRYRKEMDKAPKLIAKGRGFVAEKIIEIARQNNIPLKYDPDLLEALSKLDIGQEVPPEMYMVVAHLLAFVYKLNKKQF